MGFAHLTISEIMDVMNKFEPQSRSEIWSLEMGRRSLHWSCAWPWCLLNLVFPGAFFGAAAYFWLKHGASETYRLYFNVGGGFQPVEFSVYQALSLTLILFGFLFLLD